MVEQHVRVVLVDDHPVVRAGVRALVDAQDDLDVVGEAADSAQAVAVVAETKPDVVLMDLSLGDGPGGAETTRLVRDLPSPPQVLVLTTYDTEADVLEAVEAGAAGYLLKDAPPDELFRAIRGTARGETVLAPSVATRLLQRAASPAPKVSPREVEILRLLARGLGNKEMARELLVSEATVKSHLPTSTPSSASTPAPAPSPRPSSGASCAPDRATARVRACLSTVS